MDTGVDDISALLDVPPAKPTLLVDTQRCRYSSELTKELQRCDLKGAVKVVDIGMMATESLETIKWLVGTPLLVEGEQVYLGVDAFRRSRAVARDALAPR